MGFLDEMMADDMANAFLDLDGFAEEVVYTKADGTERTIRALVQRDPPAIAAGGVWVTPKMMITVANNATDGILSSELDEGADTLTVAYRKGADAEAFFIQRHPGADAEDAGALKLLLH